MREHPHEKQLRKVHQLTPALRELVARMARAEAKDAVQDVMQAQGLPWRSEGMDDQQWHDSVPALRNGASCGKRTCTVCGDVR